MRILIIEDYLPLRESAHSYLVDSGYAVDSSATGDEGLWYAQNHNYDAILLDIMLPGVNGLDILKSLRKASCDVPIILTSALDSIDNRVEGLNSGADDYLIKPYSLEELLARVKAHIRAFHKRKTPVVTIGSLHIDLEAKKVTHKKMDLTLSAREYSILEYLAYRQGKVVTREELWSSVYGEEDGGGSNAVDVYIGYLRKKINFSEDDHIQTHRGQGYSLKIHL